MKILVIDDDIDTAKVLREFFELVGHECTTFSNPFDGLAAYKSDPADVIITDIMMPKMSGIELLEQVRSENPDAYVIMMTGFAETGNSAEAVDKGAFAFFGKPLNIKEILNTLMKIESEFLENAGK